jgi:hypothetical protein
VAKVERVASAVFGSLAIKRKESAEDPTEEKKRENPDQQKEEQAKADRQSVEKAIVDLKGTGQFTQTGMGVEVTETKEGLTVRLLHPSGTTIRTMSAEEFIKLRDASAGKARGKLLDQKF